MTDRRDFLKQTGAAATVLMASGLLRPARALSAPVAPETDAAVKELLMVALDAARMAGASYADVRIGRQQQHFVITREQQIQNVVDTDTMGCGVRALVDGVWGFAATRRLTREAVAATAREAAAIARANRLARGAMVEMAPAPVYPDATWQSPFEIDPWTVPVEEKVDLLLRANAEALKVPSVRFVNSALFLVKDERNFASTDGSVITQMFIRSWPTLTATAVAPDFSDFQTRTTAEVAPMGLGWEHVVKADLVGNAGRWAEEAAQKLSAKPVEVGRYDLILHPSHLWLTIHESIGHPTELDRAMGYEANFAGTSFLAPPERVLGQVKYGPEWMQVLGDRSQVGALSTIGYDDEGVRPVDHMIVKDGMFNDYQTTREQALWLKWWYDRQGMPTQSYGCSYAQGWDSVQFQRMPNVSLLPGEQDTTWDDIIADTENGIAIVGDGSFSIDQQRYNAQFGGQVFYEVKDGQIVGMLKDVAYQMRTTDFWNSMDMIGGRSSYDLGGSFFDGKGQPSQSNAVSHGCPPARFRQQNVINTGRRA